MIRFDHVTFTYAGNADPTLRDVDLDLRDGELALVIGPTGSGKSTLLKAMNGLVPHFTGGTLAGAVTVGGRSTRDYPPRQLAETVGYVIQDPVRGFVTDTVEAELAWTMEQLGVEPAVMRRRVEDMFDLLGLAGLRDRPLATLSAGQAQRVAIGAALTPMPQALVLDEPTSALDPAAAEEVLAAITRLVHDLGLTVVMAEHRLERAVQFADRILEVGADGRVRAGRPEAILAGAPLAPPVVELGRVAGWRPLPLTVRDARRRVPELADRLPVAPPARFGGEAAAGPAEPDGPVVLRARGVTVRYGRVLAVDGVDLDLVAGRVTALMGRNGSGKSSLLWALHGAGESESGEITHWPGGNAPIAPPSEGGGWSGRAAAQAKHRHWPFRARGRRARPGATPTRAATVGLVPSQPGDLLSLGTVAAEYEAADRRAAAPPGTAATLLATLAPGVPAGRHPHDLSEGQRLALALAVQLAARPDAVLLDEPTRGLDYLAKARLAAQLRSLADQGRAVLVVTHDVEFAAEVADDVLIMAGGRLIASGPAAHVLAASPAYAPQVAKALAPLPYLTVGQVRAALGVAGPAGPPAPTDPVGTTAPAVPRDAPVQGGGAR